MMRVLVRLVGCLGLLAVGPWPATSARSDVVLYSNVTTFSGSGFPNGGAANVGGDNITKLVADDITPGAGLAGGSVDAFTFSVANFNTTNVSARPRVRFYQTDGASGGPGTLITGLTFNPISFASSSVGLFTFSNSGNAIFSVPSTSFWAGITFDDNNGATGATLAQLNNLGEGIFGPPTVGSSQDVAFVTNNAGAFFASNPAGTFFNFGGTPPANFGWAFSGTPGGAASVPEPSPLMLAGAAGLVATGGAWVRRRRSG